MRLDHDPYGAAGDKLESIARGQGQVHLELRAAAIDYCGDGCVSPLQPLNLSRQNITRAQSARAFGRQQKIAGAKPDAQGRSDIGSNQRGF